MPQYRPISVQNMHCFFYAKKFKVNLKMIKFELKLPFI